MNRGRMMMDEGGPGLEVEVGVEVESGPSHSFIHSFIHLFTRSSDDNDQTAKFHQFER